MKTTIELPDDLIIAAKKQAAEARSTLRELVERGLRRELRGPRRGIRESAPAIRWVTVDGGLPTEVDLADRSAMSDWLQRGG